jgi:hypothetical protein
VQYSSVTEDLADATPIERIARTLMYVGAGVAVFGVMAWILDFIPVLPAWMIRIAIYKMTFTGAAGLIFGGAALRKSARRTAALGRHRAEMAVPEHDTLAEFSQAARNAELVEARRRPGPK